MKKYKSNKIYEAVPMTRNGFYNTQSVCFDEEEGDQKGYLLIDSNGCRSWVSKMLFKSKYQEIKDND